MNNRDILFSVLIVGLGGWSVATWARIRRHGPAFVSLLCGSISLAMYALTFAYVVVADGPEFIGPSTRVIGIALSGLLLSIIGLAFGVRGLRGREIGGLTSTVIAFFVSLLWLPVLVV